MRQLLRHWFHLSLVLRILTGLVVGAILGIVWPGLYWIGLLGTLFVSALKAIAPVLVAVLVASSIANAKGNLGPRFRTVISLYLLSTLLAAVVAVLGSFLFPVQMTLAEGSGHVAPNELRDIFSSLLTNMVSNPLYSVTSANYLGVLFWAIILGFALKRVASPTTLQMVSDFSAAITRAVRWVIQFAPFGILGLVYSSVGESGLEIFTVYGALLLLLVGAMLVCALVVNPLIVYAYLHRNPYPLVWQCLKESGINAFFTRSSAANIPVNMVLCQRLGIERDFYSVSIPLGATINMNGAAVTITVMTLAVCHTLGLEVSFLSALVLSIISTLAACGASGVAGGSLLLIPIACSLFGIDSDVAMQAVGVGFIIGVVQDSVETALNSSADVLFTVTAERYRQRVEEKK